MVCFLGYGTVEQFEVVCKTCNESLLQIVDHPNLSKAHVFCYGSTDEKHEYERM